MASGSEVSNVKIIKWQKSYIYINIYNTCITNIPAFIIIIIINN